MSIRDVILQRVQKDADNFESKNAVVKARTVAVDYANSPKVAGREGFIWIKEFDMDGGFAQVLNVGVPDIINLPVLVYQYPKAPYIRQARGIDHSELINYNWDVTYIDSATSGVGSHHKTHEWQDWTPGSDVINIYPRSVVALRTYPSSTLEVFVDYYRYTKGSGFVVFPGGTIDISSHASGSPLSVSFVLVYLNTTSNSLEAVSTTVMATAIVGDQSDYWPDLPTGAIPSAIITVSVQSSVTEQMITDVRDILGSVQQANIATSLDIISIELDELDEEIGRVAVQAGPPERMKITQTVTGGVFSTGVWYPAWNNNLLTKVQDSDGGFPTNSTWYTVQRGGDYQLQAILDIDPTTTPGVVSEQVAIYADVSIDGTPTGYPVYGIIDVSTTTLSLNLSQYLPLLSKNNSLSVDIQHTGVTNTSLTLNYTLSISLVGVDHSGGV